MSANMTRLAKVLGISEDNVCHDNDNDSVFAESMTRTERRSRLDDIVDKAMDKPAETKGQMRVGKLIGWCPDCGHMVGDSDTQGTCERCGVAYGDRLLPLDKRPDNAQDKHLTVIRAERKSQNFDWDMRPAKTNDNAKV